MRRCGGVSWKMSEYARTAGRRAAVASFGRITAQRIACPAGAATSTVVADDVHGPRLTCRARAPQTPALSAPRALRYDRRRCRAERRRGPVCHAFRSGPRRPHRGVRDPRRHRLRPHRARRSPRRSPTCAASSSAARPRSSSTPSPKPSTSSSRMPADTRKGTRPWRPPSSPAPAPASATPPRSIWRGTATASSRACATSVRPARSAPPRPQRAAADRGRRARRHRAGVGRDGHRRRRGGGTDRRAGEQRGDRRREPLELTPEAEHRQMFETNYFGAVRCIQAVLPAMRERAARRDRQHHLDGGPAGRRRTRSRTPPPSGRSNASARRSPTRCGASASASSTSSPASS